MAPNGTFGFVTLTLRNWPMEILFIIGIYMYVAQVVLVNVRLGFGGTIPNFYRDKKLQFLQGQKQQF